jgi:progressive ankylosis protein
MRDAYSFFTPLILMTELNMISKFAIQAFLARSATPGPTMAAFHAAFTCYYAMVSATEVCVPLGISYIKSRADVFHVVGFMALVLTLPMAVVAITVFTPVGDWMYGEAFGLSKRAVAEARMTSGILMLSAPILLARGTAFALLMMNRRTLFITASTLVRLSSLVGSLFIWPLFVEGAAIGAAALVTCMAAETLFAWCFAWRLYLALPLSAPKQRYALLWRFTWPLALNHSAEMGTVFIINLCMGRLNDAELALAAFGMAHSVAGLLMAPLRNLAQTAQTLVARRSDVTVLLHFSTHMVAALAIVSLVLFHSPALARWVLIDQAGLTAELFTICAPAMQIAAGLAVGWGFSSLFRGLLAGARTTGALAVTGILRLLTAAIFGASVFLFADLNGAVIGMSAWIASYAVEAAYSGMRLHRMGWYAQVRSS